MKLTHHYISVSDEERKEMLKEIGIENVEDLYSDIPEKFKLDENVKIPAKMSELEVKNHLEKILSGNNASGEKLSFLGGGVWNHYIPEHVFEITNKAGFKTSYTPYQAEVSQGTLQALFEYQSMMSELIGLPIVNASMYDWGSALGEAALMCSRITGRNRFMVPEYISPNRLSVLEIYSSGPELEIVNIPQSEQTGELDLEALKEMAEDDTAGIYIENPSYLGFLETQLKEISEITDEVGALFVVGVNPLSLGFLKPPEEYGADIVVGEGHHLGNPMNFGGPLLGIFGCRDDRKFIRQFPGRVSGITITLEDDERGFVIALQTREQHIRREKATSNICTNNTLCAIASAVYLASLGPKGLRNLALKCAGNADYAMKRFNNVEGVEAPVFDNSHFNEFTVSFEASEASAKEVNLELLKREIFGGKLIGEHFPELKDVSLWCTTELHSKEDIDLTADLIEDILEGF